MRRAGVLMPVTSLPSPWGVGTMGAAAREFESRIYDGAGDVLAHRAERRYVALARHVVIKAVLAAHIASGRGGFEHYRDVFHAL